MNPARVGVRRRRHNPLEPYNLEVVGSQSLAQQIADGIETSADLCQISPSVCVGNLGIPRTEMPQVGDADAFLDYQQDLGRTVTEQMVPVGELKATQREINACKVRGMLDSFYKGIFPGIRNPIIVSEDGYVLDGHHRWATLMAASPDEMMNVSVVSTPIEVLLDDALHFPGVTTSSERIPAKCTNPRRRWRRHNGR